MEPRAYESECIFFFISLPQSPLWVTNLLSYIVERVPARVGEESWVEGQSDGAGVCRGALHRVLKALRFSYTKTRSSFTLSVTFYLAFPHEFLLLLSLTTGYLQDSYNNDEEKWHQFGISEDVLHQSPPLHTSTVNEDEDTWNKVEDEGNEQTWPNTETLLLLSTMYIKESCMTQQFSQQFVKLKQFVANRNLTLSHCSFLSVTWAANGSRIPKQNHTSW